MSPAAPRPSKLKVLVVDDNDDTRFLLGFLLEERGYEVQGAGSKQAALQAVSELPVDVLISDLGLPDGTGNELVRELGCRGAFPYAIAISGFGSLSDIEESRAAGFRHHLVKPLQFDELERLLEEAEAGIRSRA